MKRFNPSLAVLAIASAALLSACGGGGGGDSANANAGGSTDPDSVPRTISNVFDYVSKLIAGNSANSEPVNINPLTLATEDTVEPQAVQ